jgi:hypothetical protein
MKVANNIGAPISVTNDTDIYRLTFTVITQDSPSMGFCV